MLVAESQGKFKFGLQPHAGSPRFLDVRQALAVIPPA